MAETTRNLGLPLIAAAQAQKHVTHNEALTALDALVQLACLDKDLAAPPASPAEGDRYLVTAPSPSGAWTGLSSQVAWFHDGVWEGLAPEPGWLAYVLDEGELYSFTGSAWIGFRAATAVLQNLSRLGIGADADATNRLSVRSEAVLFSWDEAAPGTGSLRLALNKQEAGRDAALSFQTGYGARALVGLLASDDLSVKVSPDGASFRTALSIDSATGVVTAGFGAAFGSDAARGLTIGADALVSHRRDEAGLPALQTRANAGIAGAGQGVRDAVQIGSDGSGIDSGYLDWYAAGSYADTASRSAKARLSLIQAGTMIPVCLFDPALPGIAPPSFAGASSGSASLPWAFTHAQRLQLAPLSADPATGLALGGLYANSTAGALKWHDGAGWVRINNFAKFAARTNFDNYLAAATWTKVQFNSADSNEQGAFSATDNCCVAPEPGLYQFSVALIFKKNGSSAPSAFEIQLYRNGMPAGRGRASATGTLVDGVTAIGLCCALPLAASDAVEVRARFTGADGYVAAADSFFGGQQMA